MKQNPGIGQVIQLDSCLQKMDFITFYKAMPK
jgi:hypothetical protein